MQLAMSSIVASPANGSTIPFDTTRVANRLSSSNNGINLIGGQTYRLEAVVNLYSPGGSYNYLGYRFYDVQAGTLIGDSCYSGFSSGSSASYDFHAACLLIYTPPANTTIQVQVIDPGGAGGFDAYPAWGDYFLATELNAG
jgi:hypothetical protein